MNKYEKPDVQVVEFAVEEVITVPDGEMGNGGPSDYMPDTWE